MKKTLISLLSLCALVTMSFVMSDNGKAGKNGSPGENTCAESGCHTGNPLNSSLGSVTITAPTMTNWQYAPGQTYPISVTVNHQGRSLFGFGVEALQSSGANGGILAVTNTSQTQIKSASVNGNVRTNVVHKLNGGASANTHTFTFNWTAPAANTGSVTLYAAGNAADGDGNESGDYIYTVSQVVTPVTTGLQDVNDAKAGFAVYPNPASDRFTVSYGLPESSDIRISVFDQQGREVLIKELIGQSSGSHQEAVTKTTEMTSGVYFVEVKSRTASSVRRIMIM